MESKEEIRDKISELVYIASNSGKSDWVIDKIMGLVQSQQKENKKLRERVKELELIVKEAINLPKGVEPHSYSDYKSKKVKKYDCVACGTKIEHKGECEICSCRGIEAYEM